MKTNDLNGFKNCAVIVAHPDDETLWVGGTILMHPRINWTIITLCRLSDPDREPRFRKAAQALSAESIMGDLDDGPEQFPLDPYEVSSAVIELLPSCNYDLIITHDLSGEYTRHRRHEETGQAVTDLWKHEKLFARQLWRFAYEDAGRKYLPKAVKNADILKELPADIWQEKYDIITKIYGFNKDSFEALTTPKQEAFWCINR